MIFTRLALTQSEAIHANVTAGGLEMGLHAQISTNVCWTPTIAIQLGLLALTPPEASTVRAILDSLEME